MKHPDQSYYYEKIANTKKYTFPESTTYCSDSEKIVHSSLKAINIQ